MCNEQSGSGGPAPFRAAENIVTAQKGNVIENTAEKATSVRDRLQATFSPSDNPYETGKSMGVDRAARDVVRETVRTNGDLTEKDLRDMQKNILNEITSEARFGSMRASNYDGQKIGVNKLFDKLLK